MHAPDAGRLRKAEQQLLKRIARDRRRLLVGFVIEQAAARVPCEQRRDAGEIAVGDDLGEAEARLVEGGVEAVHIEEDVARDADAA